ncbi:MAG: GntR family transcriptional regulator, partial [Acidobacteriaceae bacterium]|nr:GntR family transcriptional regulator [Acidobacteriaceae bacterium]
PQSAPEIEVQIDSPTPVYRQIVEQVRTFCVSGSLLPGQQLPSVRQLAASLGVHFNTVAEAYRVLADEGWVEVKQGRGVQVCERAEPRKPSPEAMVAHGSRLRHLIAELRAQGFTTKWIRNEIESSLKGGL